MTASCLSPINVAPQQAPRPLPLFLALLQHETRDAPEIRARALAGLAAYQAAPRDIPPAPLPVVATAGHATLRRYSNDGTPLVVVPSIINPPQVLDLAPDRSLLRWLAGRGFAAHMIDWGTPEPADRGRDLVAHVTDLLLPLLRSIGGAPLLAGYCLGGTLALAAAAHTPVSGVALIAAPWRFAGFGEAARARIADLWAAAEPTCAALGLVPMEVLQSGFWQLDPARIVAKFARFAGLDPASNAARDFVMLEDWANGGAPLTYAAGRQLFDDLFDADLPGTGRWHVGGRIVDPAALDCPLIEFVSASDRIVPAASAIGLADRRVLSAGHVGMIVGRHARAQLWEPLADWLTSAAAPR
ncbi:alpha/beta fold hydrolase [Sphingomonas baiyangensis]|uniref:Alpha/beta hydrolase n=1 Tax=Sphingomonas baiyangensis TaxID=2572576 RepID=A0A4U1L2A1_9SPHN|nr:alpha/beta fold hydrolase [Sphingomonas baiyangensis]TKD50340.1 alpha/beta hydrolase [Sphingomonas baiyangensis]